MRAAAFAELTGPEGVRIVDRPRPEPGPGEAVIDIAACSLNRHDLWILDGESAMVDTDDLPFVSGLDVAGTVAATGDGVDHTVGDRVVLCPNETCGTCRYCQEGPENLCERFSLFHGGLAEAAAVPANRLLALPESVSMAEAAAVPTAYMTAYHMLRRAEISPGDTVFVPGATGGVGVAAVQLAAHMGATTVGTSSSATKLDRVRELGLDHGIESADPDEIGDRMREFGRVDAVINHLGGEFTRLGQATLRRGGTMVICGRTAGGESTIDVGEFFLSHKQIIGSTMGTQDDLRRLIDFVAEGAFSPPVDQTYPLAETGEAFGAMKNRDQVGKIVIEP